MRKLSLSLILVVLTSILGLGWLFNEIYTNVEFQQRDENETNAYLAISREIVAAVAAMDNQPGFVARWNKHSHIQLTLIPQEDFPLPSELAASIDSGKGLLLESDEGLAAHFVLPGRENILAVSLPAVQSSNEKDKLRLLLTLCFYAGVTLIMLLWAWPLAHRLIGLRDAARKFGRGDLAARVPLQRFSYIRDIEAEFNRMADRIQSLLSDNKLLSRAVSHDLKTPLARLRFGLDALTETRDLEQREKYAQRVNRDLEEMESLVETLLQYARLDENRVQVTEEVVDLATLAQTLIDTHECPTISIRFDCDSGDNTVIADKRYLAMLMNNLLNNALRHAGQRVLVVLQQVKHELLLRVEDDGPGIPESERANVTKPFWRGAQGRGKKGHGMGLAIVARIAEWHGAALDVGTSSLLGGAAIQLRFQRAGKNTEEVTD